MGETVLVVHGSAIEGTNSGISVMMRVWKVKSLGRTQAGEGKDEQGVTGMSEPKRGEGSGKMIERQR